MNLTRNVGSVDKVARLVIGASAAAWGVLGAGLGSTMGIVALVVGAVLIVTGLVNFCPLFRILGINSHKAN